MDSQNTKFNRILLTILVILYLVTLVSFGYANWVSDSEPMQWWMILLNSLIVSIPLVLLFGSIYVMIIAWREHASRGMVNPRLAKIIRWSPRVAAIAIIFFVSLFSLDVFSMQAPIFELIAGFLVHNIPSIIMIVLLVFAWQRPAVGFVAFTIAAVSFALFFVRGVESLPNLLLLMRQPILSWS